MMLDSTLLFKYESGECTEEEVIELFQNILDTKSYLWLQGQYGRTCQHLLQEGLIHHA